MCSSDLALELTLAGIKLRQRIGKRHGVLCEVDEYKAVPLRQCRTFEIPARSIEARDLAHVRRRGQCAVKRVKPRMVGTANGAPAERAPAVLTQPRAAVAADIVMRVKVAFRAAHHDHAAAGDLKREVIPLVAQRRHMARKQPVALEYAGLFLAPDVGAGEILAGQRALPVSGAGLHLRVLVGLIVDAQFLAQIGHRLILGLDRKSTRLNSSH